MSIILDVTLLFIVPGEFQIDPYTKTLGDPSRRPEIQNATIEYIASQDYMVSVLNKIQTLVTY